MNNWKEYVLNSMQKNNYLINSHVGIDSFIRLLKMSTTGRDYQTEFGDVKGFFDEHPLIWKDFENAVNNQFPTK